MRYILIILVFLSVGAKAQMVIKASAPYRPMVSNNLLLDDYTGAGAAFSLRKLDKDYTGAAIRVRKDTTGQPEQDINFLSNGNLDTVGLKNFLNARNGFIVTWYNQADSAGVFNVRNATQTVQANQPRIANLGVIERDGGEVTIRFDGSNDFLQIQDLAAQVSGEDKPFSTFANVSKRNTNAAGSILTASFFSNTFQQIQFMALTSTSKYYFGFRDNNNPLAGFESTTNYAANTTYLISSITTGTTPSMFSNGGSNLLTGTYNQGTGTYDRVSIGALNRTINQGIYPGNITELVFYTSDQTSNRSGIESNINTYYSIY